MALLTGHTGTADPIDEEYFTRESGEDSVAVHMHLDAVDGIARDVVEGFRAPPRRGLEVGGLLLGHVEPGVPPRVWIDRYQRLECEHRYGPQFALDARDIEELEKAATAIHQTSDLNIVGFYRSHTHPGFQLEETDHELIARYFSDPGDLILLIRPESITKISAQFFARNADGEVGPSGAEFPFRGRLLASLEDAAGQPEATSTAPDALPLAVVDGNSAESKALPEPVAPREGFRRLVPDFVPLEDQGRPARAFMNDPRPERIVPEPAARFTPLAHDDGPSSTRKLVRQWWPLGGAIVLVAGAFWVLLPHAEHREAAPTAVADVPDAGVSVRPLGLYVDPSGATWRISWNRDATALNGTRGVALFVRDGDDQNRIDLSPADLQKGSYEYQPKGQDVTFRLEVTDRGGRLTAESFRMKSAPAVSPDPPQVAAARPAPAAPATVRPVPRIKVPPTVPASIRPRIKQPIPIDIWVHVDEHGRVTDAVPSTKERPGLESYLARRAVAAAKQWRFDPARADGKPWQAVRKFTSSSKSKTGWRAWNARRGSTGGRRYWVETFAAARCMVRTRPRECSARTRRALTDLPTGPVVP